MSALSDVNENGFRRVVVGTDAAGESTVESDAAAWTTVLGNGIRLDEVWQQPVIPARPRDSTEDHHAIGPDSPTTGLVVRILSVPGAGEARPAKPHLHSDPSLHVITMLQGRLRFVLQNGHVELAEGESIVLRDSMHDLINPAPSPARFVYTSVPLAGGPSASPTGTGHPEV